MSRYVIMRGRAGGKTSDVPRAFDYWDQPAPPLPHPTAFQAEPVATGLLDQDGNQIWKAPDPIGFLAK